MAAKRNIIIPNAVNPSRISDFVTGFDLQHAPPLVIDACTPCVDTVGVMLAGSQLPPADIVCDVIRSEGSAHGDHRRPAAPRGSEACRAR